MLSVLLSILDRLVKLKEYRDQRLQRIYDQVLEPSFNDLLLIHRNYIEIFESVKMLLPPYGPDKVEYIDQIETAANYLREKRIEFEPIRIKLKVLMEQITGESYLFSSENRSISLGPEADEFVDAVLNYFPNGEFYLERRTYSRELLDILDYIRNKRPIDLKDAISVRFDEEKFYLWSIAKNLQESLDSYIEDLRVNWSIVCEAFAQLKLSVATRR